MTADADRSRQQTTDEQDKVVDLEHDESQAPRTIRLDREQLWKDLRETQELSVERARGRSDDSSE